MSATNNTHGAHPIKEALTELICEDILSDEELASLFNQQTTQLSQRLENEPNSKLETEKTTRKRLSFKQYTVGMLSACALFIAVVMVTFYANPRQNPLVLAIANEVVENHLKLKPLDIQTNSFTDIRGFFTLVDFAPRTSTTLANQFSISTQDLLGGRYCSIQGTTAAQLRFQPDDHRLNTFYQVAYDATKYGEIPNINEGEMPLSVVVKGLNVAMWVESDLLMVFVRQDQ